jgi:hypothetical protein
MFRVLNPQSSELTILRQQQLLNSELLILQGKGIEELLAEQNAVKVEYGPSPDLR